MECTRVMPHFVGCVRWLLVATLVIINTNALAECPSYVIDETDLSKILTANLGDTALTRATVRVKAEPKCELRLDVSLLGVSARACAQIRHDSHQLGLMPFTVHVQMLGTDIEEKVSPTMADVSSRIVAHCGYNAKINDLQVSPGQVLVKFLD
jgi:hypothetical protein